MPIAIHESNNTITLSSEISNEIEIRGFNFPSGLTIDGSTSSGNVTIDANNSSTNVFEISNDADIIVRNVILTGVADGLLSGDGAIGIRGGSLMLIDSTLTNNNNAGLSAFGANVTINNSTITHNKRIGGGGPSARSGGGIFFYNPLNRNVALTINDSTITDNIADVSGGNIFAEEVNTTINNSVIARGSAGTFGGGVAFFGERRDATDVTFTINNGQIFDNIANSGGGISFSRIAKLNLSNSQITSNAAMSGGGGINLINDSSALPNNINITQSDISNNSTLGTSGVIGGAGILSRSSFLTIDDSTITDNNVGIGNGAGINAQTDGSLTVTNSTISRNSNGQSSSSTFSFGGGIYSSRIDSLNITNSSITNNAHNNGGGLFIQSDDDQNVVLTNNTISENSANVDGGGLGVNINGSANLMTANNTISGNSASNQGGGIEISARDNAILAFVNNTISANNAELGGGINIDSTDSSNISLRSNTITDNEAGTFSVGGLNISDRSETNTLNIINTIIANSPPDRNDDCGTNFGATINIDSASIIEDGTCGALRFDDPGLLPLAENGGPTLTHALSEPSIALNTGASCEPSDQRGEARTNVCDVGAYESELRSPLPSQPNNDFLVIPLANGKTVVVPN